jgi:hypothetical protein
MRFARAAADRTKFMTPAPLQGQRSAPDTPARHPSHGGLGQRSCACGGAPGPTSECAACRARRLDTAQRSLTVNRPGDVFEQEADWTAVTVMSAGRPGPATAAPAAQVTRFVDGSGGPAGSTGLIQRQGRGERGKEEGREEDRKTRTTRAQEDDTRRGRPEGGRDRRGRRSDPTSDFESDWAGRAILERYLAGEGDWNISDDPAWTAYMERSDLLRDQLRNQVRSIARGVAGMGDGTCPVTKTFHAEVENGEGIIGYQYLHGTNKDVGDFMIIGNAEVEHVYGHTEADTQEEVAPGTTVRLHLRHIWNDKIDPNPGYGTDIIKSAIAEIITLGEAESYRISIGWTEDCTVWIPEKGPAVITGYPGD